MNTKTLHLLAIATAAFTLQACGNGKNSNKTYPSSSAASTASSVASSTPANSSSSSNSSSAAPTPQKTAAEQYLAQCSGCHGTNGNGTTAIGSSRDLAALTTYITNNMPKANPSLCIDTCASDIAAYILGGYDMPAAATPTPAFKLTNNNIATSYKVTGSFNTLAFVNGEKTVVNNDNWQWLYTSAADQPLNSQCNTEACLSNWQPVLAGQEAAVEAPFGLIQREDDHHQITLYGMPTYIKTGGDTRALSSAQWPLATAAPFTANNNWLISNGHLWIQDASGARWADLSNRTVYVKTNEGECASDCLNNWPALMAPANATATAPYSLIARNDSDKKQWAYQGQALYVFGADNAGDALGATIEGWKRASITPIAWHDSAIGKGLFVDGQAMVWVKSDDGWAASWQDINNRALYTFANDGDFNASPDTAILACTADCAVAWPPLMAAKNSFANGAFSLVARGTGMQWAYKGKPLYLFNKDNAGETTGHKDAGPWTLAGWNQPTSDQNTPSDGNSDGSSDGNYGN